MTALDTIERLLRKGFRITVTEHHRGWWVFLNLNEFYKHAEFIVSVWKIEAESPYGLIRLYPAGPCGYERV